MVSLRQRQMRNFMGALLLGHGVPMFYMGDEYGHRWGEGGGVGLRVRVRARMRFGGVVAGGGHARWGGMGA